MPYVHPYIPPSLHQCGTALHINNPCVSSHRNTSDVNPPDLLLGGALSAVYSSLVIDGCHVHHNVVNGEAAVKVMYSVQPLRILNSNFTSNVAMSAAGALLLGTSTYRSAALCGFTYDVEIHNCVFHNNTVSTDSWKHRQQAL